MKTKNIFYENYKNQNAAQVQVYDPSDWLIRKTPF